MKRGDSTAICVNRAPTPTRWNRNRQGRGGSHDVKSRPREAMRARTPSRARSRARDVEWVCACEYNPKKLEHQRTLCVHMSCAAAITIRGSVAAAHSQKSSLEPSSPPFANVSVAGCSNISNTPSQKSSALTTSSVLAHWAMRRSASSSITCSCTANSESVDHPARCTHPGDSA